MTFYHIVDIDRFFRVVDACVGGIYIQTDEGQYMDIRQSCLAKALLKMSCGQHGIERLDIRYENARDGAKLLQYMLECHCESSIHR